MTSLLSTSHINLNYPLSLQVIIPIKFLICNPVVNRNSRLSHRPTGLTCLCFSRVGHHKTYKLVKESSSENTQTLPTTPQRKYNTDLNKPSSTSKNQLQLEQAPPTLVSSRLAQLVRVGSAPVSSTGSSQRQKREDEDNDLSGSLDVDEIEKKTSA